MVIISLTVSEYAINQHPHPINHILKIIHMAEKNHSVSLTQELAQLDAKLVSLLTARTNLLTRAAASR